MEYTTVNIISSIPFSLRGMSTIAHYSSAKSLDESLSWFHVSWYFNCNCCNFPAKILHQSYNRPFIRSTAAWTVSLVDMRRQSWELFYGYRQRWQKLVRHFLLCSVLANFKYVTIRRTVRTHALQSPIRLSAVASSCSHGVCLGWVPLLSWWGVGGDSSHESTIDESVRSATDPWRISHANTVRWSMGKPGPSALNKPGKSIATKVVSSTPGEPGGCWSDRWFGWWAELRARAAASWVRRSLQLCCSATENRHCCWLLCCFSYFLFFIPFIFNNFIFIFSIYYFSFYLTFYKYYSIYTTLVSINIYLHA